MANKWTEKDIEKVTANKVFGNNFGDLSNDELENLKKDLRQKKSTKNDVKKKTLSNTAIKESKFKNKKTIIDGITFDSKKESQRYSTLKALQDSGKIKDLQMQVKYRIVIDSYKICTYIADFSYKDLTTFLQPTIVEDVKSEYTKKMPIYRLKKKLMLAVFGIEIKEV